MERKRLFARGEHLLEDAHQGSVLEGSGDALLVAQLFVDLLVSTVGALFDTDIDTEARGQGLLQAHTYTEANDGGKRAVRDGRGDFDHDGADVGQRRGWGENVDVGQIDNRKRAEGQGVFGIADGGNEVCQGRASAKANVAGRRAARQGRLTVYLLLVDGLWSVVSVGIGWRHGLVQGVAEIRIAGDQVVKVAGGAMVLPFGRCMAAAGGQIRWVQDGGVGVVLVEVHGAKRGDAGGRREGRRRGGRRVMELCNCAGVAAAGVGGVVWCGVVVVVVVMSMVVTAHVAGDSARGPRRRRRYHDPSFFVLPLHCHFGRAGRAGRHGCLVTPRRPTHSHPRTLHRPSARR